MMKIEFTGPAFAVVKEIEEFVAAWRQDQAPALPIAPEAFCAALDATTGDAEPAPKKRGRPPKKQSIQQEHAPEVASLPDAQPADVFVPPSPLDLMAEEALSDDAAQGQPVPVEAPDLDTIKAAFRNYANAKGVEAAKALLDEFGINKPSDLATDALKVEFFGRLA